MSRLWGKQSVDHCLPSCHHAMSRALESGSICHGGTFGADSNDNLKENIQEERNKQTERRKSEAQYAFLSISGSVHGFHPESSNDSETSFCPTPSHTTVQEKKFVLKLLPSTAAKTCQQTKKRKSGSDIQSMGTSGQQRNCRMPHPRP
jgi:hypothetical protein